MTDDKLSFLDEKPADQNQAPEVVQTTPPEAEVQTQPPIEEIPVAEPTPPLPTREDHNPLLPKYLDTYNELRATKQELQAMREAQRAKAEMPDPMLDPEAYQDVQDRKVEEKIWDERARMSELMAKQVYGVDVVAQAFEALQAQSDPLLGMHIRRSPHPWDEIVKWHRTQQMLSEVGEDPAAYKQRVIAEWQAAQAAMPEGQPPPASTQPAKTVIPPASLTRAPASKKASEVPVGPGQAFDTVFAR